MKPAKQSDMKQSVLGLALILSFGASLLLTDHAFAEDRLVNLVENHPAENYKAPMFTLPKDKAFIFKVEDYGAKGDGKTDDAKAIQTTIDKAIKKPGSVVLFSANTYRIAQKTKTYALNLNKGEGITVYGNGATLLISPDTLALDIRNSKNVTVRGLTIDYSPLPFMQGTVTEINAGEATFTMDVHKGYPIPSDAPFNSKLLGGPRRVDGKLTANYGKKALGRGWGVIMEPKRRRFKQDVMNACHVCKYEILEPEDGKRRVKLTLHELSAKNISQIEEGDRFILPIGIHAGGVIHITGGKENTLEDITIYASPSLTFGAKQTDRAAFRGIRLMFKPGSDRLITSCADGFHLRENRRGSVIEQCLMEGQIDDSINLYCSPNVIKKIISPKRYVLGSQTKIRNGDVLEAFDPVKGNTLGRARVVSIDTEGKTYTVELDKAIKGLKSSGDRKRAQIFYNRNASGAGYIIRNNIFRYHRRYAMFLKPANGLVEKNLIYGLNGEGIVVANGTVNATVPRWPEGPYPEKVIIRNNYIKDIQRTGIEIRNRVFPRKTAEARLVDGITLENNTIEEWDGTAILMGAVKNAVLKNNVIGAVRKGQKGTPIVLQNCGGISFVGFTIDGKAVTSIDPKNLKVDGNTDVNSISFSGEVSKAKWPDQR